MRLKRIVAAAGAAASVLITGVALGSGTVTADPGCPVMYTVAIPGTWETGHDKAPGPGMLSQVTNGLPGEVDYVTYAATAFPWEGDVYGASKKEATDNARGLVQAMGRAAREPRSISPATARVPTRQAISPPRSAPDSVWCRRIASRPWHSSPIRAAR